MKTILICALLLALSNSFRLDDFTKSSSLPQLIPTAGCSDIRTKAANDSITQCQSLGFTLAAQCIKNYMLNHSNSEKWDVLVEIPDKSDAKASVWFYDECSLRYENYGTYKLSYTIWKATASNQSLEEEEYKENSKALLIVQPNDDCLASRIKVVTDSISYCQNNDINLETSCIRNNIRTKSGEKWNVVVSSAGKSQYVSVRYDYFDDCSIQIFGFGTRKRNYFVWKAE